jgi:hypothetical protein
VPQHLESAAISQKLLGNSNHGIKTVQFGTNS